MAKDQLLIKGMYDGCSTTKAGISTIRFRFPITQISRYIQCLSYIGEDLVLRKKVGENKSFVGVVRFKSLRCDKEGEGIVGFEGDNLDLADIPDIVDKNVVISLSIVDSKGE